MKTFLGLGVLFLLSSMQTSAGDLSGVLVRCSNDWFFARTKPTVFYNVYMNHDEAFLGENCPVTYYCPNYYYDFFYHPRACGIRVEIFPDIILLKTKLKYVSRNTTIRFETPLLCVIRNHYPRLIKLERITNKTGNVTEGEVKERINVAQEDTGAASPTSSCDNPNVTDSCLPNDCTIVVGEEMGGSPLH